MKEFSVSYKAQISKGLRAVTSNPINNPELIECYNLKPAERGLVHYDAVIDPFDGSEIVDWPYPQLFIGQDINILATATQIYEVDSSWALTLVATVAEEERWDFIDFGTHLILTNGVTLVIRDYEGNWTDGAGVADFMPMFTTGCNFKGQLVVGNILNTWHDMGSDSIVWSAIGSTNCEPTGSNEAGFRNLPFSGNVMRIKRLGDFVVVYGDNGILVLASFEQTFGMREILNSGIPCKAAVAGDENEQVFVDSANYLWKINAKLELSRLGYREYISLMQADQIVVEHDSVLREYHISDPTHGYVLTEFGMGQCYQRKTTVVTTQGVTYGVFVIDDPFDFEGRLVTDVMDFGVRGRKSIELLELGVHHTELGAFGAVDWRNGITAGFARSPYSVITPHGVVNVKVTGDEFRIVLKFTTYDNVDVDYIVSKIKMVDKSYMRGPPARNISDITG